MNIVLLGGNGYIGRTVTEQWLKKDSDATFYVVSRSGKNTIKNERVINIAEKVLSVETLKHLPNSIDYIVNFIGRPDKNNALLTSINYTPAVIMKKMAEERNVKAMGFVGGTLGPKSFTKIKKDIIAMLSSSEIPVQYVEPTLVYGKDRNDSLSKMVPVFKFLGLFSNNLKPMRVEDVSRSLINKLIEG